VKIELFYIYHQSEKGKPPKNGFALIEKRYPIFFRPLIFTFPLQISEVRKLDALIQDSPSKE
jgi:hypothetical protein